MRRSTVLLTAVLALGGLGLVWAPPEAEAQLFLDGYGGYSFTQSRDVDNKFNGLRLTFKDVDFDESFVVGGRIGYWFTVVPFLGLAIDASYFRPDIGAQGVATSTGVPLRLGDTDLQVVSVGPVALLKIPIPVVKPYVFAGPMVFFSEARDKGGNFGPPSDQKDSDTSIGLKAGAGIRIMFLPFLGVFAEYQFTHFSPEFDFRSAGVGRKVETDVDTHHVVGGVTIQF